MAAEGTLLHPTRASHRRTYEPAFTNVVENLNTAVQRSHSAGRKYSKVEVLCLRWTNDDLNLGGIAEELLQTFSDVYNFSTQSFLIPHNAATFLTDTMSKVLDVVTKNNRSDNLLIVVYEGHAACNTTNPGALSIFGSTAPGSPKINWDSVRIQLDAFAGDTLVIMDCCEATTAAMRDSELEYLFASASESITTSVIADSFTQRLIDLLKENGGKEMTVAQIHAKLVENSGHPNHFLDSSPVHVAAQTKPSVTLCPFEKESQDVRSIRKGDSTSSGKVLISVRLQGKNSIPDINQWKAWLAQNIPDDVSKIKIQAVFDTSSTICLLTVPIEVWDMLKDHDAYMFIDYVVSDNKCLDQQTLPTRHSDTGSTPAANLSGLGEAVSGNVPRPRPGSSKE